MLSLNTLRQSRRLCGAVLLFLLLSLLPLRGWAHLVMHLGPPAGHPELSLAAAAGLPATPPCHAEMPDDSQATCSLCALCHTLALCAYEPPVTAEAAATADTATVPEGHGPPSLPLPERPPRH